jgi:AcrR family transcriptional regulator
MIRAIRIQMRNQRPRGTITRAAVVRAALEIADRDGVDALTIRSVAKCVGAPPMSLYTHFSNKDELLDLMYAEVAGGMYADQGYPTWQMELTEHSLRVRRTLTEHPNWAPLLSRPAPPLASSLRERVLKLMAADGMQEREAFNALTAVNLSALGLVLVELSLGSPLGQSELERRFDELKELVDTKPADDHALTRSAMTKLGRLDFADTFKYAIEALIKGLETKRAPQAL